MADLIWSTLEAKSSEDPDPSVIRVSSLVTVTFLTIPS